MGQHRHYKSRIALHRVLANGIGTLLSSQRAFAVFRTTHRALFASTGELNWFNIGRY